MFEIIVYFLIFVFDLFYSSNDLVMISFQLSFAKIINILLVLYLHCFISHSVPLILLRVKWHLYILYSLCYPNNYNIIFSKECEAYIIYLISIDIFLSLNQSKNNIFQINVHILSGFCFSCLSFSLYSYLCFVSLTYLFNSI